MPTDSHGHFRQVVFGINAFPASHSTPNKPTIFVPLLPRLSHEHSGDSLELYFPAQHLIANDHHELNRELAECWRNATVQHDNGGIRDYEYEFTVLFSNLLLWRWAIRHTLMKFRPTSVLLPSRCSNNSCITDSAHEIRNWMHYQVLHEETRHLTIHYFEEDESQRHETRSRRSVGEVTNLALENSFRVISKLHYLMVRLRHTTRLARRHRGQRTRRNGVGRAVAGHRNPKRPRILLIAQFGKIEALLRIGLSRSEIAFMSYLEFERSTSGEQASQLDKVTLDSGLGAEQGLLQYLRWKITTGKASRLDDLANADWQVLITDAQHHPSIRRLVDKSLDLGKAVAAVPEGAISYVEDLREYGGTSLFIHDKRITRFVLDDAQKSDWVARGYPPSEIHVSGYLGDTRSHGRVETTLASLLLKMMIRLLPHRQTKSTVLLTFDVFLSDLEIARFGGICQSDALERLTQIVKVLLDSGFLVLAKGRDRELTRQLQRQFHGQAVLFTSDVPWQILAHQSDAVLTRDSSVGWESLALGKPVAIWNFSDFRSFGEVTMQDFPPEWVRVVRDTESLNASLLDLISAHSKLPVLPGVADERHPPVRISSQVVRTWLDANLAE